MFLVRFGIYTIFVIVTVISISDHVIIWYPFNGSVNPFFLTKLWFDISRIQLFQLFLNSFFCLSSDLERGKWDLVHKKSIKYLNGFRWSGSSLEKDSCGSQIGRHFVKAHFRQSSQEIGFLRVRKFLFQKRNKFYRQWILVIKWVILSHWI